MYDNVLWSGHVADENKRQNDEETKAIFETTQLAYNDPRVEIHTLKIGDGFMIVHKK